MSNIIISPHCDDEILGAWGLISQKEIDEVIYTDISNKIRLSESVVFAKEYDFKPNYNCKNFLLSTNLDSSYNIFVPHPADYHPYHNYVTSSFEKLKNKMSFNLKYYSTEMNIGELIELESWKEKKKALDLYYPSQKPLWEHNAKYYLFEGIVDFPLQTWVEINFTKEGFHKWDNAKGRYADILKVKHRHEFHIKVEVSVNHTDRDIEFLELKVKLKTLVDVNNKSCEQICRDTYYLVKSLYPYNDVKVRTMEDGENGASIR